MKAEDALLEVDSMSVKELRSLITKAGLSDSDCVEKPQLQQHTREALACVSSPACTASMEASDDNSYVRHGISAQGLQHFWEQHRSPETESFTTSDVCHSIIKPATSAPGWECVPILTNSDLCYYDHCYRNENTGQLIECGFGKTGKPPAGSRSYCEVLFCPSH